MTKQPIHLIYQNYSLFLDKHFIIGSKSAEVGVDLRFSSTSEAAVVRWIFGFLAFIIPWSPSILIDEEATGRGDEDWKRKRLGNFCLWHVHCGFVAGEVVLILIECVVTEPTLRLLIAAISLRDEIGCAHITHLRFVVREGFGHAVLEIPQIILKLDLFLHIVRAWLVREVLERVLCVFFDLRFLVLGLGRLVVEFSVKPIKHFFEFFVAGLLHSRTFLVLINFKNKLISLRVARPILAYFYAFTLTTGAIANLALLDLGLQLI